MLVPKFKSLGARQVEAGALRNVLAHQGVIASHTGEPLTEELLFGIGGGAGLGYFVYQSKDYLTLFVATRITTQETPQASFLHTICERLGLGVKVQSTSNAAAAEKKLVQTLAGGRPLIAWVDPRRLPYHGTPNGYHTLVVYGWDERSDVVPVADRCVKTMTLTRAELTAARQGEGAPKFRALVVDVPRGKTVVNAQTAVKQGLRDFCQQMQHGFGPANFKSNFGLRALLKWADLLIDNQDRRGWLKLFPRGPRLFDASSSAYDQIENRGGGGSAFRSMYAGFLVEADRVFKKRGFSDVAEQFRESGRLWSELSEAFLPDSVPLFKEAKRLMTRKRALFEKQGMASIDETQTINTQLDAIRLVVGKEFPLSKGEVMDLLTALCDRILAIHDVEAQAVRELQALIR